MAESQKSSKGVVLVTGASTGIGKVCALFLDHLGFQVFAGVRRQADGEALKQEASNRMEPVLIDVTDEDSIASARVFVAHRVRGAGLMGLVNNAGIEVGGLLEFLPIDAVRRQFEVNVFGHLAVIQAFLPLLRAGSGRIVNMGSITGVMAQPYLGAYSASKFALEAITDSLRMELRPWRIHVAIIEPSVIKTPMWDKAKKAARETVRGFPRAAHDLYGPAIKAVLGVLENPDRIAKVATPARVVAKAVVHALTSKRPKARYVVGWDAKLGALAVRVLPNKLRDGITMFIWRRLGLKEEV